MTFSDLYGVLPIRQWIKVKMLNKPLYSGSLRDLDMKKYEKYEVIMISPEEGDFLEINVQ